MASKPCHLTFLSLLIIFQPISTNAKIIKPASLCASFDCGDGLTIRYPFWVQNQQSFCGYPNLSISCVNNQPILSLTDSSSYLVRNFNASEKSLTVLITQVNNTITCPTLPQDFMFEPSSSLDHTKDNKMVHFYYNCTLYPPSASSIKCLQRGAKHSYAFVDGYVPEFDWARNCESLVTIPVIDNAIAGLVANGSEDALREGFKLRWKSSVDSACQLCEADGGFCGYTSNSANTSFFCQHTGEISLKSRSNYTAIGALIFGGLLTICIGVYFITVNKNKVGERKWGFSRIPSKF